VDQRYEASEWLCMLAQIHLTRWLVMLVGQATKSKP
jgi:hypothetical protein